MKISKLKIENLYGIEQLELDGKSIELTGSNGMGKSSVLDAIRLALTNNSKRKYIVKNGQTEGRVLVELDNGITIDRKKEPISLITNLLKMKKETKLIVQKHF